MNHRAVAALCASFALAPYSFLSIGECNELSRQERIEMAARIAEETWKERSGHFIIEGNLADEDGRLLEDVRFSCNYSIVQGNRPKSLTTTTLISGSFGIRLADGQYTSVEAIFTRRALVYEGIL